jgi:hypothetical protein
MCGEDRCPHELEDRVAKGEPATFGMGLACSHLKGSDWATVETTQNGKAQAQGLLLIGCSVLSSDWLKHALF